MHSTLLGHATHYHESWFLIIMTLIAREIKCISIDAVTLFHSLGNNKGTKCLCDFTVHA